MPINVLQYNGNVQNFTDKHLHISAHRAPKPLPNVSKIRQKDLLETERRRKNLFQFRIKALSYMTWFSGHYR